MIPDTMSSPARGDHTASSHPEEQAAIPARSRGSAMLAAVGQMLAIAATVGVSIALARAGQAGIARLWFLVAALATGAFYIRRSPWLFLTATFWFWTVTAFVRRVIDYSGAFTETDLIVGTPSAMTLLMLGRIVSSQSGLRRQEAAGGLLVLVSVGYGIVVSFVSGDLLPGLVAAADWLGPLLYFFYFLALASRIEEAERDFAAFFTLNLIVIAGYGLYQYLDPPVWDALWIRNSGLLEFGPARPYEIRVFGTLNAPVWLAIWLGTLLILALHFRTRLMLLALPLAAVVLLTTLVRAVTGCTVLGLLAALLLSRRGTAGPILQSLAMAALLIGTAGSAVFVSNPDIADRISKRFETLNNLENDWSGWERQELYAQAPEMIDKNPLGVGIGAVGRGAVAGGSGKAIIDSGPIAIFLALGWVMGGLFIIGIVTVLVQALQAARAAGSQAAVALAAASLAGFVNLAFNGLFGFYAAVMWFCLGYACAIGIAARTSVQAATRRSVAHDGVPLAALRGGGR
jgi:hypothetical protein